MSNAVTLPSIHPFIRGVFLNDASVKALVGQRAYPGFYPTSPAKQPLPAIRFRFGNVAGATEPAPAWWQFTGDVEIHADDEDTADKVAEAVLGALLGLTESTHPEVVVQGVLDWGITSAADEAWTPPKPYRIVTVTLTVRAK